MNNLYLQSISQTQSHIGQIHQVYQQQQQQTFQQPLQQQANYLPLISDSKSPNSSVSSLSNSTTTSPNSISSSSSNSYNNNNNKNPIKLQNGSASSMANDPQFKRDKEAIIK